MGLDQAFPVLPRTLAIVLMAADAIMASAGVMKWKADADALQGVAAARAGRGDGTVSVGVLAGTVLAMSRTLACAEAERGMLGEELSGLDTDLPEVMIGGKGTTGCSAVARSMPVR